MERRGVGQAVAASDVERLLGVPLGQLAAVHAALAEGFALDEVLAIEELPTAGWPPAELAWKKRLVDEQASFEEYRALLMAEEERLARPVVPLDSDVEAWVQFLAAYGRHAQPFELLDELGMRLNDMARLGRHWARQMSAHPKLAKRAAKLAKALRDEEVVLPAIAVGDCALGPSAHAGSYESALLEEAREAEVAALVPVVATVFGLAEYAALSAELGKAGGASRDEVLARFSLDPEQADSIEAAWQARLASDRALMSDYRALLSHHLQRSKFARADGALRVGSRVAVPTRAQSVLDDTLPHTSAAVAVDVLPFRGSVTSLPPAAPGVTIVDSLELTSDMLPALLEEPELPFASAAVVARSFAARMADDRTPSRPVDMTTVAMRAIAPAEPLPFMGSVASMPLAAASWTSPRSSNATQALDLSLLGTSAIPFDDAEGEAPSAKVPDPTPPSKEPPSVWGAKKKRRAANKGVPAPQPDPLESTLHFVAIALDEAEDASDGSQDAIAPSQARLPLLTVAQFASLHAELSVSPNRAGEIRRRYQLADEAMQRRLDAEWMARLDRQPDERARYQKKLAEFTRWLRSKRKKP